MVDPAVEVYAACQVAVRRLCRKSGNNERIRPLDDVQTGVFAPMKHIKWFGSMLISV